MKTKEEIIINLMLKYDLGDNSLYKYTTPEALLKHNIKVKNKADITMDQLSDMAYELFTAGFESFREKAEEGVKKQNNYIWQHWGMDENSKIDAPMEDRFILRDEVLTTIREIKE